jgi:hypothetical protein
MHRGQNRKEPRGKYPRLLKTVGKAPEQYPDPDDERRLPVRELQGQCICWYEPAQARPDGLKSDIARGSKSACHTLTLATDSQLSPESREKSASIAVTRSR